MKKVTLEYKWNGYSICRPMFHAYLRGRREIDVRGEEEEEKNAPLLPSVSVTGNSALIIHSPTRYSTQLRNIPTITLPSFHLHQFNPTYWVYSSLQSKNHQNKRFTKLAALTLTGFASFRTRQTSSNSPVN